MSTPPIDSRDRSGVQVVQRVAAILAALQNEHDGLSLSQIAGRVGLARSTVHRLIAALEAERYVVAASPNGRYRLGPGLASLALSASRDLTLTIHPFLAQLSRETNETVDLAVLEHDHVVFVDQVAGLRRLRAVSAVGTVFPVHCTANGKALLAALTDDVVERLLAPELEALTPATITSRDELLGELRRIREEGVAYDREEHTAGICAVGAVVGPAVAPIAAVTIPLPAQRFYGHERQLADTLLGTCREIDAALGT
jgi:DNA-binding IclR family transcriptional regulator